MMRPGTETELAELLQAAGAPLAVRGGGTRGVPLAGEVLETGGLSGVRLYEPGALTLVVGAGTPLAEVEALLAEKGQRLAFEPMDHRALLGTGGEPTIGGVVAANVSGPRRVQVGACRDHLLGVRFVSGAGEVVSNGGRVMKNVTGYDLVKLMAGSWGTLGVLTEVSLKVLARPQAEATLVRSGQGVAQSVTDMCRAMGTPYDVSGAGWAGGQTRLRVEGLAGSVAYRAGALNTALGGGWDVVEGAESAALWQALRDVSPFAGQPGAVWKLSVKPTDAPGLLERLSGAGVDHEALLDWSGGLIWLRVPEEGDAGAAAIRAECATRGGHATLIRAGEALRGQVPMFQPRPAPIARLEAGLRAKFDPRGLLNPGLMEGA
ncbi:FAD-binding protein [Ferrimonas balearica]|nr:FAD-binding protein [Ferrimonas balearica]